MKRIAVFIAHYSIGNSPSILNLLDLLSDCYKVDLFLQSVAMVKTDVLNKRNVSVLNLGHTISQSYLRAKLRTVLTSYYCYICFDPHGFALCKQFFPDSRPIYYSLELYMKNDHYGLFYPAKVMERERSQINTIRGLIIPSREKELLFRQDYNLSPDILALLLPVTYKGRSMRQKSLMVREHYGIDSNKKIALHLGGIAAWFSCIEMAIAFSRLENWVLLFHGYQDQKYVQELKKMLMQHDIKNVIISDRLYDSLDDVNPILQSCDMGIAWYNNITVGFRTAGKSSGKIPAYLKFGLPVIAKKYPSTIDALEKTGCGVCIDTIDDIALAISSIEKDYATYAENAYAEYDRTYNFELYHSKIIEFIERSVQA